MHNSSHKTINVPTQSKAFLNICKFFLTVSSIQLHHCVYQVVCSRQGMMQFVTLIDIGDIYIFVTWLPISMCQNVHQHHYFMYDYKLTLEIFEITPKSEEIVNFYLVYCKLNVFLIRTTIFSFDKLHFLLIVGDMLEQTSFGITDS